MTKKLSTHFRVLLKPAALYRATNMSAMAPNTPALDARPNMTAQSTYTKPSQSMQR